ncbi:MAG: rhodanese-like domain-containing protein [Bacilli bacterium]
MKKLIILTTVASFFLALVGCESKEEKDFDTVDAEYIEENLGSENFVLIDARDNSYFIGNTSEDTENGGHITGATDFSANWLDVKDVDERLAVAMEDKGINEDIEVVVYDTNEEDAIAVAEYFTKEGIEDVKIFSAKDYINENADKLTSYENYQYFLPAYGVNQLLEGNDYQGIKADNVKFFEASWGEEEVSYTNGHVPTSVHINTDEIESAPLWSLNSDEDLIKFLDNNGIMKDDTIILSGNGGHMATSRIAVILRYLGVEDVHILNGGIEAYERAGYELETDSNPKVAEKTDIIQPLNPDLIDTMDEAKEIISSDDSILLDIRTEAEWLGETSGYSDLENQGRIKGAIFHGGVKGETPGDVFDYTNVDGTMRNFDEVLAMWENAGIDYEKHLSFYCGSGWRTAEVLMYGNTYGMDNLSMYSNGWYEWSTYMSDEIETGK